MTAYPTLVHTKFAQKRVLPEKMGDTIVFRRYSRLSTVPIPLNDGVTPPGAPLSATDIKARVSFYGNFVTVTNQVQLTVEDRVLNESSRLLAQNLAQTMDEVTRDVLASTSSVLQCSNGVNGRFAVVKSSLIDLEAYGESYGDRAQAEPLALAA